jgi:hypothetical protein
MRSLVAALVLSAAVASPAFAAPKKDAQSYNVELKAAGPYKKGVEGTVELTLTPKPGYHVNPDYPTKFKVADPAADGVTYPKKVLKKEDGKFEEKLGTLKIPFVADKAGKTKVAGVFQFSVCSDKNCFMEKAELDVDVDVK